MPNRPTFAQRLTAATAGLALVGAVVFSRHADQQSLDEFQAQLYCASMFTETAGITPDPDGPYLSECVTLVMSVAGGSWRAA